MSDTENVPIDVTAMHAEEIVKAAIALRWKQTGDEMMSREQWVLFEACNEYGKNYKGLRAQ